LTRTDSGVERALIFNAIKEGGAKIVCCDGTTFDAGAEGERGATADLLYTIQSWVSAQERVKIRARTQAGKTRVARSGGYTGFKMPFGIEWACGGGCSPSLKGRICPSCGVAKKFHVDAKKGAVVRRIFEQAAAGRSARQIADGLNADNIASPPGGSWIACSVLNVLHNDKYATGKLAVTIGGGAPIPYEQGIAPVVAQELFDRVQAQLAGRRVKPPGPWSTLPALLRGLGFCGKCGASTHVTGSGGSRHIYKKMYYRCSSAHHGSKVPFCGLAGREVRSTDAKVWDQLSWTLTDKTLLAKATALTPSATGTFEAAAQAASCKEELRELARREKKLAHDFVNKHLGDAAYDSARGAIETRRTMLEHSLKVANDAQARVAQAAAASDSIFDLRDEQDRVLALIGGDETPQAAQMRRCLLQTYSFEQQRKLVQLLVPRGVDGFGFFLQDNGTVTVKGALESRCGSRNLHNSTR
jgi:hypothetical protein